MTMRTATSRFLGFCAALALLGGASAMPSACADAAVRDQPAAACCACCDGRGPKCGSECLCQTPDDLPQPAPFEAPKQTRRLVDAEPVRTATVPYVVALPTQQAAAFLEPLNLAGHSSLVAQHVRLQI